ncbi:MAG: TnpV protein [Clostridia bacterium]|nr:TnpV protein [Clostridia bacterium]
MERFIHDETNGLGYELVGDYYLPCLKAPEAPKVGRFGLLYYDYLRNHKRVTYSGLVLSGKLKEHIEDIDRQAEEMFSQLVEQMKQAWDVTEQLKADEQMAWIGAMNNILNRAMKIVMKEIIYN